MEMVFFFPPNIFLGVAKLHVFLGKNKILSKMLYLYAERDDFSQVLKD
jgi:hypothetical protein